MKTNEYLKQLRGKNAEQLNEELMALQKEQFNLRLQTVTGQQNKSHLAGGVKQRIARLKTIAKQQATKAAKS
ncbi:MAG TPA: 50S ribosomal protein L29 [Verrucomicrobiae bacterium]|nr:50S ribosomal protein L29 [Verrucomicrobiae bacterium]